MMCNKDGSAPCHIVYIGDNVSKAIAGLYRSTRVLSYFHVSHTHTSVSFGSKKDTINQSHRFIKAPVLDTHFSTLCSIAAEVQNML